MEVQCKQYLFEPLVTAGNASAYSRIDSVGRSNPFLNRQTAPRTPFLHNFYHDVESLWWIGVHSLCTTEPSRVERDQDARRTQREHFDALFPHHAEGSIFRLNFLRKRINDDTIQCLPREFLPVVELLDVIRDLSPHTQVQKLRMTFPSTITLRNCSKKLRH